MSLTSARDANGRLIFKGATYNYIVFGFVWLGASTRRERQALVGVSARKEAARGTPLEADAIRFSQEDE